MSCCTTPWSCLDMFRAGLGVRSSKRQKNKQVNRNLEGHPGPVTFMLPEKTQFAFAHMIIHLPCVHTTVTETTTAHQPLKFSTVSIATATETTTEQLPFKFITFSIGTATQNYNSMPTTQIHYFLNRKCNRNYKKAAAIQNHYCFYTNCNRNYQALQIHDILDALLQKCYKIFVFCLKKATIETCCKVKKNILNYEGKEV